MHIHALALAPAKVNLGLEVLGRRADGFHDIATILQTVSLFDRFEWVFTGKPFVYQSAPGIEASTDLVTAALGLSGEQPSWIGTLRLVKQIPIAAGLGGGSSDAALALLLGQPDASHEDRTRMAVNLGSDVPFFLTQGTALATGTGTVLEPLPAPKLWFVIVTPKVHIPSKTAVLYRSLGEDDFSDGAAVAAMAERLRENGQIDAPPSNAFERQLRSYPPVEHAWQELLRAGAPWVSVSGAGPSIYTAVRDYRQAAAIRNRLTNDAGIVNLACSLPARDRHVDAENLAMRLLGRQFPR